MKKFTIDLPHVRDVKGLMAAAIMASQKYPLMYVTAHTVFQSAMLTVSPSLNPDAPGFTHMGGYFKRGEFKPFTKKQVDKYLSRGIEASDR